jgi:hypothetical protein
MALLHGGMSHIRLTHPDRATLPLRQGQQDSFKRKAVANATSELATDRPTLVHTETRESTRTIRGTVTGLKRKRDSGASDAVQALTNYAAELESHVDEFQGDPGYTLEDDQLNISKTGVLESIEWSLTPGRIYELEYEATVRLGRGTFESRAITSRTPTVDTGQTPMLIVDGNDLPGMRDYKMNRSVGVNVNAVFDRDSAENNDVVFENGTEQTVVFEGEHSGTLTDRQNTDAALAALVARQNSVTLETRFPGYSLDIFVTNYESTLEQQRGGNSHRYRIEMIEGTRA